MQQEEKKLNSFDQFTNLYELSKTLRFELKPVGKTKEWLKKYEVFKKDEQVAKNYQIAKPYFDLLHKRFIFESLKNANINNEDLEKYWLTYKQKQADKKVKLDKIENELRTKIVKEFAKTGDGWKNKYSQRGIKFSDNEDKGFKFLFGKKILDILKIDYSDVKGIKIKTEKGELGEIKEIIEKDKSLFETFPGSTYFSNFQNSRMNFYSDKGIASAIPTRIINDNLKKFCDNKWNYEQRYTNGETKKQIESLLSEEEKNIFRLDYFNACFLQSGIDNYNKIIGQVNGKVNELRQKQGIKAPFFKELFKQILEERIKQETEQDKFIKIEDNGQVFEVLQKFVLENQKNNKMAEKIFGNFISQIDNFSEDELEKIYISDKAINTMSNSWFTNWNVFGAFLPKSETNKNKVKSFISIYDIKEALENPKEKNNKDENFVKIDQDNLFRKEYYEGKNKIIDIEKNNSAFKNFLTIWAHEFNSCIDRNKSFLDEINKMISQDAKYLNKLGKLKNGEDGEIQKEKIKDYAESALAIYQIMKYFLLEHKKEKVSIDYDPKFYDGIKKEGILGLNDYFENENGRNNTYLYFNELRNYLSKKPYDNEKIKLNFENGVLAGGWDKNEETKKLCVILKKNKNYFLGIMNNKNNYIFENADKYHKDICEKGFYEKMNYKYFPEASKMIPKCSTQLQQTKKHFQNSQDDFVAERGVTLKKNSKMIKPLKITKNSFELNNFEYKKSYLEEIKTTGQEIDLQNRVVADSEKNTQIKLFQKDFLKSLGKINEYEELMENEVTLMGNVKLYRDALNDWIKFCKEFLECYESSQNFDYSKLRSEGEYLYLDEFYKDVNQMSYKKDFNTRITEEYIDEKIENGELYLFEIYNKDFSDKANGKKNLHTLYWENLFSKENLKNPLFKLNGQAEIFYREPKIKEIKEIKTENSIVINKDNHKGEKAYQKKRFMDEKIMFHCPITLNFSQYGESVNGKVIKEIADKDEFRIIGIDRGEKHLLYLSSLDFKEGKIAKIEVKSLNSIFNGNKEYSYHEKLDKKEKERDKQRKSWQSIQGIKDMKMGYVSQAVHEIANKIIESLEQGLFPIIVFENLNIGFKRGRFKIEKQVYQNFELALAKKLNYLVSKDKNNLRAALQLTPIIQTFEEIDKAKQFGIIFYIPASFTSAICPKCGFRKCLYGFGFTNKEQAKKLIFEKHNFKINYDDKKFIFECTISGEREKEKNKNELFVKEKIDNIIKFDSDVERLRNQRSKDNKKWETVLFNSTEKLLNLFSGKIDLNGDISKQIMTGNFNSSFYEDLISCINMILHLRNSHTQENRDFINCPSCHFHSEEGFKNKDWNGDANGAYNIGRKGILIVKKIKQFVDNNNTDKFNQYEHLKIEMKEWDKYTQIVSQENEKLSWTPISKSPK